MSLKTKSIAVLFVLAVLLLGYHGITQMKRVSAAYVYGYPLLLMDRTRQAMLAGEFGINRLAHNQQFPDHTFRNVVRPNNDTLYSVAWLDLADEAQVLSVPDTLGRYYVMPFMDAWTNVFAMVGKRTTGTGAGTFLITGPDWHGEIPPDVTQIVAPTNMVWIIGRIQTDGVQDVPAVSALQQQFTLSSLGQWRRGELNAALVVHGSEGDGSVDPYQELEGLRAAEFLDALSGLMGEQYPAAADKPVMELLAEIGVVPGEPYAGGRLGWLDDYLSNLALDITLKEIKKQLREGRILENGWAVARDVIGDYGTHYEIRAAVAMVGLGALPPAEATYPGTTIDSNGQPLNGQHRYQIHFAAGETPPTRAFWSLTMYDESGFLVDNPIGRYAIGDRDALQYNEDGSLDIFVQKDEPKSGQANWLPAPEGAFALTIRIYYPEQRFLNGSWKLPELQLRADP